MITSRLCTEKLDQNGEFCRAQCSTFSAVITPCSHRFRAVSQRLHPWPFVLRENESLFHVYVQLVDCVLHCRHMKPPSLMPNSASLEVDLPPADDAVASAKPASSQTCPHPLGQRSKANRRSPPSLGFCPGSGSHAEASRGWLWRAWRPADTPAGTDP